MDDSEIEDLLESFYSEDFHYESGRVLGSMYTHPPDIVLKAFFRFYQSNLGNPGLYPGTAKMEKEVVKFLIKLTHGGHFGKILSGGTEANITALWAAREMGFKKILTTEDVHFSVLKAANLLSMEIQFVRMKNFVIDPKDLEEKMEENAVVVATAGTTPLGYIDPVEKIGKICSSFSCFLHVDAAFGGFVIPFLYPQLKFGFRIPEVRSVTIDPHKMGMAPYPAGGLVTRENIFARISVDAPYLMEGKSDSLLGTRQSGSVAASYAAILHFGWEGYEKIIKDCMENAIYLEKRAREEGFQILARPVLNIVNIVVDNEERIKKKLLKLGWAVSTNPKYSSIRIVVMPHVKKEIIDKFLENLKKLGVT